MNNETTEITLEDFANPTHSWHAMNDPVMGGKSHSKVSIQDGFGTFDGEVVDVPFLHAPGFITMRGKGDYPDVSSCQSIKLTTRAAVPYAGYRISFGKKHVPGNRYAYGYKANFDPQVGNEMGEVEIPFHDFTVRWDDATGDAITTCEENESFCPDVKTLQNMKTISIWGEGVAGKVQLEIESIKATNCSEASSIGKTASANMFLRGIGQSGSVSLVILFGIIIAGFVGGFVIRRQSSPRQTYSDLTNSTD